MNFSQCEFLADFNSLSKFQAQVMLKKNPDLHLNTNSARDTVLGALENKRHIKYDPAKISNE